MQEPQLNEGGLHILWQPMKQSWKKCVYRCQLTHKKCLHLRKCVTCEFSNLHRWPQRPETFCSGNKANQSSLPSIQHSYILPNSNRKSSGCKKFLFYILYLECHLWNSSSFLDKCARKWSLSSIPVLYHTFIIQEEERKH